MSSGQRPRNPGDFPRMKWRARKRLGRNGIHLPRSLWYSLYMNPQCELQFPRQLFPTSMEGSTS